MSISDDLLLAAILAVSSGREPRRGNPLRSLLASMETIHDDIGDMLTHPAMAELEPKTKRDFIAVNERTIVLDEVLIGRHAHKHTNVLIQHEKEPDVYLFYSLCPGSEAKPFILRGIKGRDEAVRKANLILDFGLGLMRESDLPLGREGPGSADGSGEETASTEEGPHG